MNFFISTTQLDSHEPSWDRLLNLAQKKLIHPRQKSGFLLSRSALLLCLRKIYHDANISDLELIHFSRLKKFPDLTLSLSHSPAAGAAIVAKRSEFKSVGIDIESKTRKVNNDVAQRIHHPEDYSLNPLEAWCLKEAIYKTLMNLEIFDRPIGFSQIRLLSRTTWIYTPTNISGEMELTEQEDLIVALAWIKT